MTTDERLEKIDKRLEEIHTKLFVGNGRPAITMQIKDIEDNQRLCPARIALTTGGRALKLQTVTMIVALLSLLCSIGFSVYAANKSTSPQVKYEVSK